LLKTDHNPGAEVAFFNTAGGVTYRPLDELSDSDEAEMDISGDEAETTEEPSNKRARVAVEQSASDNNAPKWSNPDPYTVLPPDTATQGKKKDVVQLIRKSRVEAKAVRTSLPSESADFISFDFDDSDASDNDEDQESEPAPTPAVAISAARAVPSAKLNLQLPPKPPAREPTREPAREPAREPIREPAREPIREPTRQPAREPAKLPALLPDPMSSALGSRKRTHDDEIKMPHAPLKKVTKMPAGGGITKEWLADPKLTPTPWMEADHSQSANIAVW
jgi:non-canonical poly(A) RNA polymerase PAPD5/7